jgi:hypothetical protein
VKRLVLVALLVLALGACGDDDDPAVTSQPEVSVAESPGAGAALDSALSDVNELAPALESYFRSRDYPTTLADVVAALPRTGLELSPGNSIGGYRYQADEVEFVLCGENTSGAWATYDTAPMTTGQSGRTGGCPSR